MNWTSSLIKTFVLQRTPPGTQKGSQQIGKYFASLISDKGHAPGIYVCKYRILKLSNKINDPIKR